MSSETTGTGPGDTTSRLRQRRTSNSTTDTLLSKAKELEAKVEHAILVLWDDLPDWRRDNAYILSGYRASSNSYLGSFKSLFWLHNESVNIWTHLIGSLVFPVVGIFMFVIIAPRYPSADSGDIWVLSCFFGGAVICLGMSATYHMLCNHSAEVAKWGNKLDYTGIVALIVGSYVPALYYGLFCLPKLMTVYLYGVSFHFPIVTRRPGSLEHAGLMVYRFFCWALDALSSVGLIFSAPRHGDPIEP